MFTSKTYSNNSFQPQFYVKPPATVDDNYCYSIHYRHVIGLHNESYFNPKNDLCVPQLIEHNHWIINVIKASTKLPIRSEYYHCWTESLHLLNWHFTKYGKTCYFYILILFICKGWLNDLLKKHKIKSGVQGFIPKFNGSRLNRLKWY